MKFQKWLLYYSLTKIVTNCRHTVEWTYLVKPTCVTNTQTHTHTHTHFLILSAPRVLTILACRNFEVSHNSEWGVTCDHSAANMTTDIFPFTQKKKIQQQHIRTHIGPSTYTVVGDAPTCAHMYVCMRQPATQRQESKAVAWLKQI